MEGISVVQIIGSIFLILFTSAIIIKMMFNQYEKGKRDLIEDMFKNKEITTEIYVKYIKSLK